MIPTTIYLLSKTSSRYQVGAKHDDRSNTFVDAEDCEDLRNNRAMSFSPADEGARATRAEMKKQGCAGLYYPLSYSVTWLQIPAKTDLVCRVCSYYVS